MIANANMDSHNLLKGIRKAMTNRKWTECLFISLFAVLTFIFLVNSPLHPWNRNVTGADSSVFKTVALMMEKGYLPYKDSFDHKGPIIYLINLLGNKISSYRGVWIIEFFSLFATIVISYYSLRRILNTKRIFATIAILTGISLLFSYFEGGNLTEEYAMPFISVAIYVFLDYFMNDKTTPAKLIACGLSCGVVLFLRANMVSIWAVFCIVIILRLLTKRKIKVFFTYVGWFLLGLFIVIGPIVCWLGLNHALGDFWFDYVKFNLFYSSAEGGRATVEAKWDSFFHFFNTTVFAVSFFSSVFLAVKTKRLLWTTYSVALIVSVFFICVSGMQYNHYGMILIPMTIIPIGGIFTYFAECSHSQTIGAYLLAGYFLCTIIFGAWSSLANTTVKQYYNKSEDQISNTWKTICSVIQTNSNIDDKISVYGNLDFAYVISERAHATKFSYQFPIGTVYPEIMTEYWEQLKKEQPVVIIVQKGHYDGNVISFFDQYHYSLLWAEKSDSLNEGVSIFTNQ